MKISKEKLLQQYYSGWELSEDNEEFPNWFNSEEEKFACLLGFSDFDMGIYRETEEIIEKIQNSLK